MKLASIELITEITPHLNADSLEFASVAGYKCIVGKGAFKVGSAVLLIQPDTILPDEPWAEMFKKKSSRVRAVKLRGQWSFGIAISPYDVTQVNTTLMTWLMPCNIGKDISEDIGVVKYEPPVPQDLSACGYLPTGLPKTDEERFQNIEDLPFGELVDLTLKIDGTSSTYYCKKVVDGNHWETGVCSRSLRIKSEADNHYTRIDKKYRILEKLLEYCQKHDVSLALRGEIFGQGIQSFPNNPHATGPVDFACFSVFNMDKQEYENTNDPHNYLTVAGILEIPIVDQIGRFILDKSLILHYSQGIDKLNGKPFEGIVVKHATGSFKVINLDFDTKK